MIDKAKLTYPEWRIIRNAVIEKRYSLRMQAKDLRAQGFDSSPDDMEDQADEASRVLRQLGNYKE